MERKESAKLCRMTEDEARTFIERIRWPEGPVCPHCQSKNVKRLEGKAHRAGVHKCREAACRKQFTATVGTIFHGSRIALRDWVYAFARMCASKKGVSALQLQRELSLTYRSAWFLAHRVRAAMKQEPLRGLLQGVIEADETYVGGKPREPRRSADRWKDGGWGGRDKWSTKVPVVALVERGGRVRTRAVTEVTGPTLKSAIQELVEQADPKATLMTDESRLYPKIGRGFAKHLTVNHGAREYHRHSDGAGINTAESFFAIMKRGVYGTFHNVSKRHLENYCAEFEFRWNHREVSDTERTIEAIRGAEGKRMRYRDPVKKAS